MKPWLFPATFVVVLFASGCAGPPVKYSEEPLSTPSPRVEVHSVQNEIDVLATHTDPMMAGGGLLGALIAGAIDNSRQKAAEHTVADVRNMLVDYDFRNRYINAFGSLGDALESWLDKPRVKMITTPPSARDTEDSTEDIPSVTIKSGYALSNDLRFLIVTTRIIVLDKRQKSGSNSRPRQILNRGYEFVWGFPEDQINGREESVREWKLLGKDRMIELVDSGIEHTLKMFARDLGDPDYESMTTGSHHIQYKPTGKLREYQSRGELTWVRDSRGNLYVGNEAAFWN